MANFCGQKPICLDFLFENDISKVYQNANYRINALCFYLAGWDAKHMSC